MKMDNFLVILTAWVNIQEITKIAINYVKKRQMMISRERFFSRLLSPKVAISTGSRILLLHH